MQILNIKHNKYKILIFQKTCCVVHDPELVRAAGEANAVVTVQEDISLFLQATYSLVDYKSLV